MRLIFAKDPLVPVGLRSAGLSAFHTGGVTVLVRELLQNALDAGAGKVVMQHDAMPTRELPAIQEYRHHLRGVEESQAEHVRSSPGAGDVLSGMQRAAYADRLDVLWVRDDGKGLDASGLSSLLADGQSLKSAGSAGSYGNGHQAFFAHSRMRFLLYAGQTAAGRFAGGHVRLATHRHQDGVSWGADGVLCSKYSQDSHSFQWLEGEALPRLLARQLDCVHRMGAGTGSVVGIVAFEPLEDFWEQVRLASASAFIPAFSHGRMTLECVSKDGRKQLLAKQQLPGVLAKNRPRNRPSKDHPTPTGEHAFALCESLDGAPHVVDVGHGETVTVHIRADAARQEGGTPLPTRVHVFREGMWIGEDNPKLKPRHFAQSGRFIAAVLLRNADAPSLCALVQQAEGPKHASIAPQDVMIDATKRKDLLDRLDALQKGLDLNT